MLRKVSKIFSFAEQKLLTAQAYLKIRNSQTYQISIPLAFKHEKITLRVPKNGTLADISRQMQEQLKVKNVNYLCNQKIRLPEDTPIDALINRYFFIYCDQYYLFPVEGQLFDYGKSDEVVDGIVGLELPAVTKREVQNYISRVNQWVQFHTGKGILDPTAKVDAKTAAQIFVQSAIQPQPRQRRILQIHEQWQKLYWQVQDLKKKKKEADEICMKNVRRKMSWGLIFLGANIMFIWSGTYIFYSWDIIQPLAYFISSMGAIILAAQFFKLGRPYSNVAYQQYLMQKISPRIYKKVGFSMQQLVKAENQLIELECAIKDYYLQRL